MTGTLATRLTAFEDRFKLHGRARRAVCICAISVTAACLLLICAIPAVSAGAAALCNHLFAASESVNAYKYAKFAVGDSGNESLAAILTAIALFSYCVFISASGSRILIILTALLVSGGQAYFGLSLPPLSNAAIFAWLAVLLLSRRCFAGQLAILATAVAIIFAATALFNGGVDAELEMTSERVRDYLGRASGAFDSQAGARSPDEYSETRHANEKALLSGNGDAQDERDYRLITRERSLISRPSWTDYLKIALLLLLTIAVIVSPFIPFVIINRRRSAMQAVRADFDSDDCDKAVRAIFHHVVAYLDYFKLGAGNKCFVGWPAVWGARLPDDYRALFTECVGIFEIASYSPISCTAAQRERVKSLLDETERMFFERATKKQRFDMRYVKCLHE